MTTAERVIAEIQEWRELPVQGLPYSLERRALKLCFDTLFDGMYRCVACRATVTDRKRHVRAHSNPKSRTVNWRYLDGMQETCPVCGAQPGEPCHGPEKMHYSRMPTSYFGIEGDEG